MASTSSDSGEDSLPTFVDWFRDLPGRDIFTPIPLPFLEDDFNLFDVHTMPNFQQVLDIILDNEPPPEDVLEAGALRTEIIHFYELVHQRYIQTKAGMHEMVRTLFFSSPSMFATNALGSTGNLVEVNLDIAREPCVTGNQCCRGASTRSQECLRSDCTVHIVKTFMFLLQGG
jgi:hypothetical protein